MQVKTIHRSSVTGRFVTTGYLNRHPHITETEHRVVPGTKKTYGYLTKWAEKRKS